MLKQHVRRREAEAAAIATGSPPFQVEELVARLSASDGAVTGPTIAGCRYATGTLRLSFNGSLLGGEGLMLRPFDDNSTGGWGAPGDILDRPVFDASGAMVCTVDPDCRPSGGIECGNATTCQCQSWNYVKVGQQRPYAYWYCEVGPGWKPSREAIAVETRRRLEEGRAAAGLGWVPSVCPFQRQWQPAPLRAVPTGAGSPSATVEVDLTSPQLAGRLPLAVRLAWPLFGSHGNPSDTCCPTASVQGGRGVCIPGNCPLYTNDSQLPANPFFATITDGRCACAAPQVCSA